ncbi:MAG: FecR domain-containing protein [Thermoleophilia bacterium]|nr:FecR domain-containing protein [Thermoleophilia bacterium]
MSIPFAAIDTATITALNGGDEKALEKIFRAHYDVLIERANERLKDEPAAAPRLVAGAMREVWEGRAGFKTSGEIEAFLNEELRNRARAMRARLASVHRFEKKTGGEAVTPHAPPTMDVLWAEIRTEMHKPTMDPAEAAKQRRAHAAHDAASHIAHVADRRPWKGPALIGTLGAIVIIGGVWWANQASKEAVIGQLLASNDAQMVQTRQGQSATLPLSDSTVVRLAAESRMVMIPRFGRDYRAASVVGSAFFTVAAMPDMALEIRMDDIAVIANSGEFAVRNFPDDRDSLRFVVARSEGVRVKTASADEALTSGQTVAIDRTGAIRDATEAEAAQYFAWVDGKLVLRDVTVAYAASRLWRWFGMEVAVVDSAARGRTISISVPLESSKAAVDAIAGAGGVVFGYDKDNKMQFTAPPASSRRAR